MNNSAGFSTGGMGKQHTCPNKKKSTLHFQEVRGETEARVAKKLPKNNDQRAGILGIECNPRWLHSAPEPMIFKKHYVVLSPSWETGHGPSIPLHGLTFPCSPAVVSKNRCIDTPLSQKASTSFRDYTHTLGLKMPFENNGDFIPFFEMKSWVFIVITD